MRWYFGFLSSSYGEMSGFSRVLRSRILWAVVVGGVLLAVGAWLFGLRLLQPVLRKEVASEGFREMLSREVSKSMKVDGTFSPLKLEEGWTVTAESFASKGWPGEAIGALDAEGIRGVFDPEGIFRRVWQMDLILIDKGRFELRQPDDALKRPPPPPGKRPWYAALMPQRFHCRWIDCPDAEVSFPLGDATVELRNMQLGATMIGQNFKYYGHGGDLVFPRLPAMAVDALEVYVTREMVDVGYAYLRQKEGAGKMFLTGRMGQREDRSIDAQVTLEEMDVSQMLPGDYGEIVHGLISGEAKYQRDTDGKNATGSGSLRLTQGTVSHWEFLDRLAEKQDNPSLKKFDLDLVTLDYTLNDEVIEVTNLVLDVRDKIQLKGSASWGIEDERAAIDIDVERMMLEACLPVTFKNKVDGVLSGTISWRWTGDEMGRGSGGGTFRLKGGRLKGFKFQRFLARFFKEDKYLDFPVQRASLDWEHSEQKGTVVRNVDIYAKDIAGLRGELRVAPDGSLSGVVYAGVTEGALTWLPKATETVFPKYEDGMYWAKVTLSGTEEKPENDLTEQILRQLRKYPLAMAVLVARGLSWWIGDKLEGHKD